MSNKILTRKERIGRLVVIFSTKVFEGEAFDTEVTVDGECLCWITQNDIDSFVRELNDVIEKYQI